MDIIKKQTIISIEWDVQKQKSSHAAGIWCEGKSTATLVNNLALPEIVKHRVKT